jgi:hypothetical protein
MEQRAEGKTVQKKKKELKVLPENKYAVFSATKDAVKMENRMQ